MTAQFISDRGQTGREAIILIGHGSRIPGAGRDMEEVVRRVKEKYGYQIIEICFMSGLGPHFPEVFEKCVNQGATKILVIPYFLHEGRHLIQDIPEMMKEEAKRFPGVKVIMGKGFGFDEALVDLVHRRVEESREIRDMRDLEDFRRRGQ